MTDTAQTFDPIENAKAMFLDSLESIRIMIASPHSPVSSAVVVSAAPEEINAVTTDDGGVVVTNDYRFSLGDAFVLITAVEINALMQGGGDFRTLLMARLETIGAYTSLTDAQLIRALLARLGGEITLTAADMQAGRRGDALQFDGLTIKLIPA